MKNVIFIVKVSIEVFIRQKQGARKEKEPICHCNMQNGHLYIQRFLFVSLPLICGIAHDSTVKYKRQTTGNFSDLKETEWG